MTNNIKFAIALLLYRLAFLLLTPIILLLLVIRSKKNPAYRHRLFERLGFLPTTLKQNSIVIHAASVGEVIAIKSFVETLITQRPEAIITITTFTPTGSEQVKKLFADRVQHCYLPLDNVFSSHLFLKHLKPQALVLMETELWPNLITQCHDKKIPLLLINARLSAKSCANYQKIRALIKPSLQCFAHILCQSKQHQQNFIRLGAKAENCSVSGNLKYDIKLTTAIKEKAQQLSTYLPKKRSVWLVASTHSGDDELILEAFSQLKRQQKELLLILAPRHPERFEQVAKLCLSRQFNLARRSEKRLINESDDIWLLDSLGELTAAYSLASVVTIAGTFSTIGGHNPLEAALYKKAIVVGADMANFSDVQQQLLQNQAIVQLTDTNNISNQLGEKISQLLNDRDYCQQLGENAYQVMLQNQGASVRSVNKLIAILSHST